MRLMINRIITELKKIKLCSSWDCKGNWSRLRINSYRRYISLYCLMWLVLYRGFPSLNLIRRLDSFGILLSYWCLYFRWFILHWNWGLGMCLVMSISRLWGFCKFWISVWIWIQGIMIKDWLWPIAWRFWRTTTRRTSLRTWCTWVII